MGRRSLRPSARALGMARYEVIPTSGIEEAVLEFVPRTVTVTVTASPTKGLERTLDLSERLRREGFGVVPHVSARLVRDEAHLADILDRVTELGITDLFVPAGDAEAPAGRFDSSLALLEALQELSAAGGRSLPRMGITGYPESHPKIGDDVTIQAMWDKRRYASYIVSNLCFDPRTLQSWVHRVRARGVALPILLGMAGPVERQKLLAMASKIGVADSARYLRSHSSSVLRLGAPGGYAPDRFLGGVGALFSDGESKVDGLHVFTFNQLRETERWRQELLERIEAG